MSQGTDWLTYSKFTPADLNNPTFQSFLDFNNSIKDQFGEEKPYKFKSPCYSEGDSTLYPLYAEVGRVHPHRIQAYLYFREQRANSNNPLPLRKQYNAAMRTMEQSFNKLHCKKGDAIQRLAKISMLGKHTGRNFALLENIPGECKNDDIQCRQTPIKFVELIDLYNNPLINYQELIKTYNAKPISGGRRKTRRRRTKRKRRKRKTKRRRTKTKRRRRKNKKR